MARRLLDVGHDVFVYDVNPAACTALAAHGAKVADSIRAVGDAVPIVFLSLPQPQIVIDAVLGSEGLISAERLEVCVDLSTSGPAIAAQLPPL